MSQDVDETCSVSESTSDASECDVMELRRKLSRHRRDSFDLRFETIKEHPDEEDGEPGWISGINTMALSFRLHLPSRIADVTLAMCALPVSIAATFFIVTFLINFGLALLAQLIATIVILLCLVPSLTVCLLFAIIVAYFIDFCKFIRNRLITPPIDTNRRRTIQRRGMQPSGEKFFAHPNVSNRLKYFKRADDKIKMC